MVTKSDQSVALQAVSQGILLEVKVVPKASREAITGVLDGRLKIALTAPAEQGKANRALQKFLAKKLGLKKQAITITKGLKCPTKTLLITGCSRATLQARIIALLAKTRHA